MIAPVRFTANIRIRNLTADMRGDEAAEQLPHGFALTAAHIALLGNRSELQDMAERLQREGWDTFTRGDEHGARLLANACNYVDALLMAVNE